MFIKLQVKSLYHHFHSLAREKIRKTNLESVIKKNEKRKKKKMKKVGRSRHLKNVRKSKSKSRSKNKTRLRGGECTADSDVITAEDFATMDPAKKLIVKSDKDGVEFCFDLYSLETDFINYPERRKNWYTNEPFTLYQLFDIQKFAYIHSISRKKSSAKDEHSLIKEEDDVFRHRKFLKILDTMIVDNLTYIFKTEQELRIKYGMTETLEQYIFIYQQSRLNQSWQDELIKLGLLKW